ncbi:putative ribonuclease H-like domain-containing protein [Tanacetum coccineum]|uniref:Ribonuclease H-like domain-containing protein n=1 Tax=Tanacetum coccineum TaxID=301880 RepID=A0ABQ4YKY0_9ASTR
MDVKSAFLYGTIEEEVYVCQPPGFEDLQFPDKVYKVEKALYGLHQAPKASYETLSTYLLENRFRRGTIDKTLFIKKYIGLQVKQKDNGIFISQDKYVADILKKFDFTTMKTASTLIETNKALLKDEEAEDVDVHLYISMIGLLMYLTASRLDIMFVVCACARFQVTPKVSHLLAVKRIFRYLKGQPKLGLWYPRDSPFDLEAFSDSDYVGASLDRKSTTGGCQFLGKRLISWQCKKQTIVANSTPEAEYVAADTQFPQTSVHIPNVADEAVFKEWDDRVVRATTTAASLDAAQASGDKPRCQEAMGVSLLRLGLRGHLNILMIHLSQEGSCLGTIKDCSRFGDQKAEKEGQKIIKEAKGKNSRDETLQDCDFAELDVDNAMENVKGDAETQGRNTAEQITTNGDTVNTASIDVSTADPSTSTAGDIFEDEMMTIADTLVAIRSTRPRTTSVVIRDVEEEPRRATPVPIVQSQDKGKGKMVEPEPTPKNPIKAQIQRDAEIAQRLHEKEKAKLERMQRERVAQEEASNAALIAEFDNVQARMEADALLAARLQEKEREQFSIDEQARFLVETIAERKRFFAAQRAEQIRNKPPTKIQLRNKMITYLKNMGRFTYNQLKNKSFEEIQKLYKKEQKWIKDFIPMDSEEGGEKAVRSKKRPRAEPDEESVKRQKIGETSKTYQIFADMLKKFNRDDLVKLWDLVKKRFSTTEPTNDKEKELWVELKTLFEPDNDDILWKLQRYMHDPLKEYPLTRGTLGLTMVARLLVEADSEMSRELLRKIFYQANRPRQLLKFLLLVEEATAGED